LSRKRKPAASFALAAGFGIVFALLSDLVQRIQHDRRPATGMVVVMPISMMAANCADHCPGLIPDSRHACQTFSDVRY
jgi:hypothetical protein